MNSYLTPLRIHALAGGLVILSSLLLDACASSRLIKKPLPPTKQTWVGLPRH